jgi:hypothetical protein
LVPYFSARRCQAYSFCTPILNCGRLHCWVLSQLLVALLHRDCHIRISGVALSLTAPHLQTFTFNAGATELDRTLFFLGRSIASRHRSRTAAYRPPQENGLVETAPESHNNNWHRDCKKLNMVGLGPKKPPSRKGTGMSVHDRYKPSSPSLPTLCH